MIKAKYNWCLTSDEPTDEFNRLAKKLKLDELTAKILYQRGMTTETELAAFLTPDLTQLYDPFLLHDMQKAVTRILSAIERNEKILVYGDYDADGMTSASIMKSALDELGADELTQVYLPNRFTDGYGPNLDVYKYFIEQENIQLIITVDNGVSGIEPISWAQKQGVDVIVTDHHSMSAELPNAYAIVHPKHPDSKYPFEELCGAGVAFKVACALLDSIPVEMLDLVAIGTVADMVSLTDENRVLVSFGLKQLAATDRVGLLELMRLSGTDLGNITEETIGFQIAPRLNALGRLDDPNPVIELLTGWDEENTAKIAAKIEAKNKERRRLVESTYKEAESMLDDNELVHILYKSGWHKGVLGIVAGRLLEKTHRPVIMLGEEDGILKGSARSIEVFDIFEALSMHSELFIAFGGHRQAAGMTFAVENIDEVRQSMAEYIVENNIDMSSKPNLILSGIINTKDITLETIKELEKLAPYGMNNPKPRFLVEDYKVTQSRAMGTDNQHLKLKIEQEAKTIDAIYFGHGAESLEFEQAETRLAVSVSSNSWNDRITVQWMIEDAEPIGTELIDIRGHQIDLPSKALIFEQNNIKNDIMNDVFVIADAPSDEVGLSILTETFKAHNFKLIYFKNAIQKQYYLMGSGTHEQFVAFYKLIFKYSEFDVRYKLKSIANYLNCPELLLIKMIQIFEELGFVNINDGVMTVVKNAPHREIGESIIYQKLQSLVKMQEFWALAPVQKIYNKLKNGEVEK